MTTAEMNQIVADCIFTAKEWEFQGIIRKISGKDNNRHAYKMACDYMNIYNALGGEVHDDLDQLLTNALRNAYINGLEA